MSSKISKILPDSEKYKSNQVIGNRDISELWNGYKKFKAQFHAHHTKLEQFTLKVLKLRFFANPTLKKYVKSRKININIKSQFALIKKAISIHLRSLQLEQRLYEENQYLKELLNNSYKIVIKEKNSLAIEMYEMKDVKTEEKCFKSGLEYILRQLEDVSNKTKLKARHILEAAISPVNDKRTQDNANGEKLFATLDVVDPIEIERLEKFNLQIDAAVPPNSHFHMVDLISERVKHLNSLVLDVKPVYVEVNDDVQMAKSYVGIDVDVREKADEKRWKNKRFLLNYIRLFFPLSFLVQKSIRYEDAAAAKKKFDKSILQNEYTNADIRIIAPKDEGVNLENLVNLTCTAPVEEEAQRNIALTDEREESLNLSEVKAVEFYDIPISNTDIHDYTISWLEQQNERDFHYVKQYEKMENDKKTKGQSGKRKSIMKRSMYSSQYDDFKDYLKTIISYSEEFSKRDSSSTINPLKALKDKKKNRLIDFPSSEIKNILQHNANNSNYKLPKMPDMNKTYQIVFQQNMPQGFSLKFVKSREKDFSTLIVSNGYPTSKTTFPKTRLNKK